MVCYKIRRASREMGHTPSEREHSIVSAIDVAPIVRLMNRFEHYSRENIADGMFA